MKLVSTTTQALNQIAQNPGDIYFTFALQVVPQCSVKSLPIQNKPGKFIAPYQGQLVLPFECPSKRNKLNIEVFDLEATRLRAICSWWSNRMGVLKNKQVE